MKHYDFASKFRALYDQAATRFAAGRRGAETFFPADELSFLSSHGITGQHVYDYAEDLHNHGEPNGDIALSIELIRRDYFLTVQEGQPSSAVLDAAKLPAKTDAVRGIGWLPRLLPKARAKLRGELPASTMYCCGGDRAFFQEHDIQPGEFLHWVWHHENDDNAVVERVLRRRGAARELFPERAG